ncbi:MAG: hypothetical protein WBG71_06175 [Leeuwenhoekiella sp.]
MEFTESITTIFKGENFEAPIFIAVSTLLALVSLRNAHLSDRARQTLKKFEETDNGVDKDHYRFQAEKFILRYKSTGKAFGCLLVVLLTSVIIKLSGDYKEIKMVVILVWIAAFTLAILLIGKELWNGRDTLVNEAKRVKLTEDDKVSTSK